MQFLQRLCNYGVPQSVSVWSPPCRTSANQEDTDAMTEKISNLCILKFNLKSVIQFLERFLKTVLYYAMWKKYLLILRSWKFLLPSWIVRHLSNLISFLEVRSVMSEVKIKFLKHRLYWCLLCINIMQLVTLLFIRLVRVLQK